MRYIRLSAVLLLLACGDGGTTPTSPPTPPTPVVTSITLSATSLSFASLGQTSQLSATVKDQNGATMSGASVSWSSSAASVATVSSTGLVTGVANGSATITVTSGSASANANASIQQVAVSITLSPDSLVFAAPGDTATVTATVLDAGGSEIPSPSLTWSSSDESTVTVSSNGLVTAVASGPAATVKVQTDDQEAEISATVVGISCDVIRYSFTDLGLVLSATDVGQTDPMAPVANPSALQLDDGRIRLFFTNAGDGIASAISDDGLTFAYETIRISGPAAQEQGVQLGPSRISRLPDGRVRLYVGSSESGVSSFISSDEGKTFNVEAGERITRTQASMDAIQKLSILPLSNGTYRGYFGPAPQHGPTTVLAGTGDPPDHWLLSATSSDLLEWTVEPGVRIGPGSTILTASAREVYPLLRDDGCVTLFYQLNKPQDAGISDYEGVAVVGYSTSSDGLTFTRQFPLITTRDPAGPDVLTMPDGSRLLYHDSTDQNGYGHGIRVGRLATVGVAGSTTPN